LGSGEAETSSRGLGPRSGEAELPVAPEAELAVAALPGWLAQQRSGVSDAIFLSDRSVEGRSDCGHFDLAE
jgi:hypothetical protein